VRLICASLIVVMSGACNFDASGEPSGPASVGHVGTDGGTQESEGDTDQSSAGSGGHDADADSGSTSGLDTSGPSTSGSADDAHTDTTADAETGSETGPDADVDTGDTANVELADLELSGGPLVQFGVLVLGETQDVVLQVVNHGPGDALGIVAEPLVSPFSFAGGNYPGAGGTCGQALAAGTSCDLVVRFAPGAPVSSSHIASLSYDRGDGEIVVATRQLQGGGQTPNLVLNPGAESGLTSWTVVSGSWSATCLWGVMPNSGGGCFSSGEQTAGTVTNSGLRQDIDVSAWAQEIDAGAVAVELRVWARSLSGSDGDPWRIRGAAYTTTSLIGVPFDSGWQETYAWTPFDDVDTVPNETRTLRVRVDCVKPSGHSWCDAYFDDFELILRPAQ
jgi:hypothetical protein